MHFLQQLWRYWILWFVNNALGKTLHELILALPDSHFLSIDLNWSRSSLSILYPLKYEELAKERIANLGPYLHQAYGNDILTSLPTETQGVATTNYPISKLDRELEDILAEDGKLDYP